MNYPEEIINKLDQIIELLQSMQQNQPISIYQGVEVPTISDTNICNCGQLTARLPCPVHGFSMTASGLSL